MLPRGDFVLIFWASAQESTTLTSTYPVTVLRCPGHKAVKTFQLSQNGDLERISYSPGQAFFRVQQRPVSSIVELAELLEALSRTDDQIIIRGVPTTPHSGSVRRNKENFAEPEEGRPFVMLDFDDVALPEGMDSLSLAAIEHVLAKLPEPFGQASYFFQFSASAGIMHPNGQPLKSGLNAHVFFYLSRPVPGMTMRGFLGLHCLETGFYQWKPNVNGVPRLVLGVDPAVIQNAVQPHYVGQPIIGEGVRCLEFPNGRQGLVHKDQLSVDVPELCPGLSRAFQAAKTTIRTEYMRSLGYRSQVRYSRMPNGRIGATQAYRCPTSSRPVEGGRELDRVEFYGEDTVRLFFAGENSPGSWFVKKTAPTLAIRFGDFATSPLIELSEEAYRHVRDELGWFADLPSLHHALVDGFLPNLDTFIGDARNCLVLAPTGSGKTTAIVRFAQSHPEQVIVYTAQTVALVNQMHADLVAGQVPVTHYTRCHPDQLMVPGVYVTTNESLTRLVTTAQNQAKTYTLVVDEAHIALDDFMASERKARAFDAALSRAARTLFLTATMTEVQIAALLRTVAHACGGECPIHSFDPVKENPLFLKQMNDFGPDFLELLEEYQQLKEARQPLPRTVIFVDTSKQAAYRAMIQDFDLEDESWIVSRPECLNTEVEAARTSDRPILITSPLFAFGLNFEAQPERLWAAFDRLPVDKNQVVQTLNRANRGSVACEVRLYYRSLDTRPLNLPANDSVRREVEEVLGMEIEGVAGVLEAHYDIDRNAYKLLRAAESCGPKALHSLISEDAIQNYRLVPEGTESVTRPREKELSERFTTYLQEGRAHYADEASRHAATWSAETPQLLLHLLERSLSQIGGDTQTGREIERLRIGRIMALCDLPESGRAEKVSVMRLLRLFGERAPFLSGQFSDERTPEWRTAASTKTLALIPLLDALNKMRAGEWTGIDFAKRMHQGRLGQGISALLDSVEQFTGWERKREEMASLAERNRNGASRAQREEITKEMFAVAKDFLATLGVGFGYRTDGGRRVLDPSAPLSPPWDFESMKSSLHRKAASLARMPIRLREVADYGLRTSEGPIDLGTCRGCVHYRPDTSCAIGRSTQMADSGEQGEVLCPDFGRYRAAA